MRLPLITLRTGAYIISMQQIRCVPDVLLAMMVSACVFENDDDVCGLQEQVVGFAQIEKLPVFTGVATDKEITIVVFVPLKKDSLFLK